MIIAGSLGWGAILGCLCLIGSGSCSMLTVTGGQTELDGQQQQQMLAVDNSEVAPVGPPGATTAELHKSLAFYPTNIDFGIWSIGTAQSHVVTLVNTNTNRSVYLNSISGKTSAFYSSFFEDKIVPPQGNTTFNVVFLPRSYGVVEANLLIHTSFGEAKLQVRGEGKECPYRLKPLIGITAPLNATLIPEVQMYNPHERPIQILEVYSSGGQFQLELPSGGQEGPQALWAIPPFTTKPVIRIRFHGATAGHHIAYIRIKISGFDEDPKIEHVLVIPVEFEIRPYYGLYSQNPILDFGSVTSLDELIPAKVDFINSGYEPISHFELDLKSSEKIVILSKTNQTITLDPTLITSDAIVSGELIIKSYKENIPDQPEIFSVAIRADIYSGSLQYEKNITIFITKAKNYTRDERDFFVRNAFSVPVAITELQVADNDTSVFRLVNFRPVILQPLEQISLFQIYVVNDTANFKTSIRLVTNITTPEFPLIVCTGLLTRYTSLRMVNLYNITESSTIDFGPIAFGEFTDIAYLVIRNSNPLPISLTNWNFTHPKGVYYRSTFLGCSHFERDLEQNPMILTKPSDTFNMFDGCNILEPGKDMAVFDLSVQSYNLKEFSSTLNVWTEFEHVAANVKFFTVMGRLEIDQSKLHFKNCFPGKRCSADISIHSTFLKTMRINSITVSVPGLVFEYHTQDGLPIIAANAITDVGRIYFDPQSICEHRCYIPQVGDVEAPKGKDTGLSLDEPELRRRTEMFRRFKWNLQTITFTLNTSDVRLFEFKSSVDIIWPKLAKGVQTLPTQEVDQIYKAKVVITNPHDKPLMIDVLLADTKKAKTTTLSLPLEVIELCSTCYLTDENVFTLDDPTQSHTIPPNTQYAVTIKFHSKTVGVFSTLLHIRNNLTLYEAVWVTAKTVHPQFRFGNRKPGSTTPLLFEILEKHLVSCDQSNGLFEPQPVNAKRTFTARNAGEVPIFVEKFQIGNKDCEGYGFKIMDCRSFELKANSSKKIDISFTPDFTLARISRYLVLKTNLSYVVNYTLLATVPPSSLATCSNFIQRPHWELYTKKVFVAILSVAFLIVYTIAYLESDKVLKDHVQNMSKDKGPVQPTLNFRNLTLKCTYPNDGKVTQSNGNVDKLDKNPNILKKRTNKKIPNYTDENTSSSSYLYSQSTNKEKTWASELARKMSIRSKEAGALPVAEVAPQPQAKPTTSKQKVTDEKSSPPMKIKPSQKDIEKVVEKKTEIQTQPADTKKSKNLKRQKLISVQPTPNEAKEVPVPKVVEEKVSSKIAPKPNKMVRGEKKLLQESLSVESKSNEVIINEYIKKNSTTSINASQQTKKHGKTPGRERKKEGNPFNSTKLGNNKSAKFKSNAFQFSSPLPNTSLNSIPNSWSTSQATFSHVVAQNNNLDENRISSRNWVDPDSKNFETFGQEADNIAFASSRSNTMDLGPIGTRKSPSSTPIWEPMGHSVLKPVPNFLAESNLFLNAGEYMGNTNNSSEQMRLMDHNRQLQLQQSANLMALLQKRTPNPSISRPIQETQQINWPLNEASWSPMGYQDVTSTNPWTDTVIQRPVSLRPPPGLEFSRQNQPQQTQSQLQSSTLRRTSQPQPGNNVEPLAAFDPFNSLSSIWADTWNNYNNTK